VSTVTEEVVLVDEYGHDIGHMPKARVHGTDTPLHLAFSCLIFDQGRLLVTRRSMSKLTWPGVWTGSCCGHPLPGESFESAISRRVLFELGCTVTNVRMIDSQFRYRAVSSTGIVENEICPVFLADLSGTLRVNSAEVMESGWASVNDMIQVAKHSPFLISPWFELQLRSAWAETLG
jgi:isopentenyl-diphosphate delta-isomerase